MYMSVTVCACMFASVVVCFSVCVSVCVCMCARVKFVRVPVCVCAYLSNVREMRRRRDIYGVSANLAQVLPRIPPVQMNTLTKKICISETCK